MSDTKTPNKLYKTKLDLLYYGVYLSAKCYNSLKKGVTGNVNTNDYITTKGMFLILDDYAYVNANLNKKSPYKLDLINKEYLLYKDDVLICPVKIVQPPESALQEKQISSGTLVTSLVNLRGDRIRIQPIDGCANRCKFCDLNTHKYHLNPIADLDEALNCVMQEDEFRHILISGGSPLNKQEDYDYLNNVYKFFGEKYGEKYPIDVMLIPRSLKVNETSDEDYENFLKTLKSWHISSLAINLELFNDELREKYIPQKDFVGKDSYVRFIKLAVKIFGAENVRSCIIVGLESLEDTLNAVDLLCSIGCMPVLSPYIPIDNKIQAPTPDFTEKVLLESARIASLYNMELGPTCDSCKNNTIHFK